MRRVACVAIAVLALAGAAAPATVPSPVVNAVHGRVVGWTKTGNDWFVVYLAGHGRSWCALQGSTWRMALVSEHPLPVHVVAHRKIGGAMCGNDLAWVRAGRFSDGRHREVAFMLWATPSLGASATIYRADGNRFRRLASFAGDAVRLGRAQ